MHKIVVPTQKKTLNRKYDIWFAMTLTSYLQSIHFGVNELTLALEGRAHFELIVTCLTGQYLGKHARLFI